MSRQRSLILSFAIFLGLALATDARAQPAGSGSGTASKPGTAAGTGSASKAGTAAGTSAAGSASGTTAGNAGGTAAAPAKRTGAKTKHLSLKVVKKLNTGLKKPPKGLDRSTPNRAWSAFIRYCDAGNWDLATHLLNVGDIREKDQREVGAEAARRLCEVLKHVKQLSSSKLPDTGIGPLVNGKATNYVVAATIKLPAGKEEVWLRRFRQSSDNSEVWLATRRTVSKAPRWWRVLIKGETGRKAVGIVNAGLGAIPAKFNLSNPRAAATTFAKLIKTRDYQNAAYLLDLRAFPAAEQKKRGAKLARRLALLLSRVHPGSFSSLSNDPSGAPEKDVPHDEEIVAAAKVDKIDVQLRMSLHPRVGKKAVWLFARGTVNDIDPLYRKIGYGIAGDYLPAFFFHVSFWKMQLWQWFGLLAGLVLAWIFGIIMSFIARKVLHHMAKATSWEWDDRVVEATNGPLKLVFASLGVLIVSGVLMLHEGPQANVLRICKLLAILGLGWFLVRTIDVAGDILKDFFDKRDDEMGTAMVPVARRIFKPIMVLLVAIVALQNAGVNVAGLIAGLGIGGIALAMAAKSTVENMLAGITIAFDRPFKVGDFVTVDGGAVTGSVEEVGLRSTRVRTGDRTVVTLPNSKIVDSRVENFAPRDRIRLLFKIGLQYDTSADQVRFILDAVKRYIVSDYRIYQDSFRLRLNAYADSSIELDGFIFAATTDFNAFTVVKEELLFAIGEIVEQAGAQMAFPTRTIYTGKASESDSKRAKQAAAHVKQLAEAGELCIPEIPEPVRERLVAAHPAPPPSEDDD